MKFRIRCAEQIVGIFTIMAMAGLVLLVFFLGSHQKWFVRKYHYTTEFLTASNISRNMPVQYKGFTIGKIDRISLDRDKVIADFYILEDYSSYVKTGSLVELIVSPIGLGTQFVFHPGKGPDLVAAESRIPRIDSPEGMDLIKNHQTEYTPQKDSISEIVSQITLLLTNLNQLTGEINGAFTGQSETPVARTVQNLDSITGNLRILSANISDPEGLIPTLLGAKDKQELYVKINKILSDIETLSGNLDQVSSNANYMITDATPQLNSILSEVTSLLLDIQDVMEGLKNNPLIKKGVPDRSRTDASSPHLRNNEF
jgi:phospholipid/cholesterol/gamma-HCH transport system substrate-binding protein